MNRLVPVHPQASFGPCVPSLLAIPAGYGGHGKSLDLSAVPALEQLLSKCDDEVALSLGVRTGGDAARLLALGSPATPGVTARSRCVAGLYDAGGEMTAYVDVVREYPEKGTWCIAALVVRPDLRGCGVAAAIVEEVEGWARACGASALLLHVPRHSAGALAFGRRSGFTLDEDPPRASGEASFALMARLLR